MQCITPLQEDPSHMSENALRELLKKIYAGTTDIVGLPYKESRRINWALLNMLGWCLLQVDQSLFYFLKNDFFHRLLQEYSQMCFL